MAKQRRSRQSWWRQRLRKLKEVLADLLEHAAVVVIISLLALFVHYALQYWFHDPKFWDLIPIRYVVDAGDAAVILAFFVVLIRKILVEGEQGK